MSSVCSTSSCIYYQDVEDALRNLRRTALFIRLSACSQQFQNMKEIYIYAFCQLVLSPCWMSTKLKPRSNILIKSKAVMKPFDLPLTTNYKITQNDIRRKHRICCNLNKQTFIKPKAPFASNDFFLLFSPSKTWPTPAISWRNLPFSQLGNKSTEKDKVLHPNVFTGNHQVLHLFLFQVVEHLVVVFQTAIRLKMPLSFFWHGLKGK